MRYVEFNRGILEDLGSWGLTPTPPQIEAEPMLFQADAAFASEHGGPLTRAALSLLSRHIGWENGLRIDTRSHMLMPGWYPCIPGWHTDFVVAGGGALHPADHDTRVKHYMLVSSGPTPVFLQHRNLDVAVPEDDPRSGVRWGDVDKSLGETRPIENVIYGGHMYRFDATELHRGRPSQEEAGHWRWFFRASYFPPGHPYRGQFSNKIRRQVQVYCDLHEGW